MTLSAVWATVREPADAQASRAVIRESIVAVRAHLGMDVAFVAHFSDDHRRVLFVDHRDDDASTAGDYATLAETYCGRVLDGRVPELVSGARTLFGDRRGPGGSAGAHLAVPLRDQDGTTIGTLCCLSLHPDEGLGKRDLDVLRMVGDVIAPHLGHVVRHEERLRHTDAWVSKVIDSGGPDIALQPIVDLHADLVATYEALARFPDDVGWPPDRWFSEAHAIGRGVELEAAAVEAALQRLGELPEDVGLSVNVSVGALLAGSEVLDLLLAAPFGRLTVELTEHQRVDVSEQLTERLATLRSRGLLVAVDDAGSGYASMEHILHLRPDVLKLDRIVVQGIAVHPGRRAMCEAMVQFTRHTDAVLVAEGVETDADLAVLRAIGVDRAQGFLLGPPVSA